MHWPHSAPVKLWSYLVELGGSEVRVTHDSLQWLSDHAATRFVLFDRSHSYDQSCRMTAPWVLFAMIAGNTVLWTTFLLLVSIIQHSIASAIFGCLYFGTRFGGLLLLAMWLALGSAPFKIRAVGVAASFIAGLAGTLGFSFFETRTAYNLGIMGLFWLALYTNVIHLVRLLTRYRLEFFAPSVSTSRLDLLQPGRVALMEYFYFSLGCAPTMLLSRLVIQAIEFERELGAIFFLSIPPLFACLVTAFIVLTGRAHSRSWKVISLAVFIGLVASVCEELLIRATNLFSVPVGIGAATFVPASILVVVVNLMILRAYGLRLWRLTPLGPVDLSS